MLKGGGQEGVSIPLPTLGEGDRGWGEVGHQVLLTTVSKSEKDCDILRN